MGSTAAVTRILHFGVFEVDLKACELRKQGLRLKLPEQPFQVLVVLLENPGEIVTRDELRNRLWQGDTFVDFDHGLNNAVMRLREVLGDSSDNPRFVETIPRRGYRFIAPVAGSFIPAPSPPHQEPESVHGQVAGPQLIEPPAPETRSEPGSIQRKFSATRLTVPAIATLILAVVVGFALVHYRPFSANKTVPVRNKSLVVLPLENLSGDKDQEYFADGMTDDLIANLAKIRSLRVISRSTAMAYKGARKPLSQIASELNVDAVVEGTVLRVGNRVRITAELVQVSTDRHLWADTYESQMGDVLALQNRVSSAIVNEIRINLTPEEEQRLASNPAIAPEAYENYLKGRYYWNKRTDENLTKAIAYFEQATRQDSRYALAYAGLSDSYAIISAEIFGTMPAAEAAPKAKAAALRALDIDPTLAEAETSLATVKFNYDWDWNGAAEGFARAIQRNPSYATAYQRYSLYLMAMGRSADSFDQINKAREIDPLSISINFSLGWRLYMARQYDRAIQQLRNTLEMDPSYELPHLVLGLSYAQKGDFALAIPELRKAVELSHGTPLMVSALANVSARSGNKAEAERLLADLISQSKRQYVSPYYLAVVYVGLGKPEEAIDCLEKAFADRSNGLVFLKVEPELDDLRSNPRFVALQQKLNFPT
ncbi:MAG TPA: winged helix-turn-helix domain-containing protein [Terriglobales bacterium]|jgi:TolB-like protein/DNA-binding winged helix-turn-helix (wHTH) protein/Tfp pilus assembly protein PilF|nr:winged helix-turn-helix domain-containing protein [Terriglobales bacterium]